MTGRGGRSSMRWRKREACSVARSKSRRHASPVNTTAAALWVAQSSVRSAVSIIMSVTRLILRHEVGTVPPRQARHEHRRALTVCRVALTECAYEVPLLEAYGEQYVGGRGHGE